MGRPNKNPTPTKEQIKQVEKLAFLGATDHEMAKFFEISTERLNQWRVTSKEFCEAMYAGKDALDNRAERSLFQRAVGYSYDAVKIFMPANADEPVYAPYTEHVPPDPKATSLWLRNRRPATWRDQQHHAHGGADGEGPVEVAVKYTVVKAPNRDEDQE